MLRGVALLAIAAGICEGQANPRSPRPCDPQTPLGPSHDLYCLELVAAPGIQRAAGRVELSIPPGPFTVSVTPDGRSRFLPIVFLSGLPRTTHDAPRTDVVYVAWATTPEMDTLIKLGTVRNGRTTLRPIALEKFNFLITAEPSARVREPGRVILRGQSPSTRLFPPDLLEFSLGAARSADVMDHGEHESSGWPMVPTPPGVTMLPSEMALRPAVTPFLPATEMPLPHAESNEVLRLQDGDIVDLDAELVRRTINGQTYTMYGYNGQYPGPLIEVSRGSEIMVRFTNHLSDSTSIHWHGIRLENAFDGVEGVRDAFTYKLKFPDAGIFWYHPHIREDIQQALGLYGNILVRQPGAKIAANREQILMLQDLLVGDGSLIPFGLESPTHALMGRFGNLFLVNGEPGYRLSVLRGEVVRFYLTNASNTRTLNLSFPGARMKVVAADAGPFEHEAWVESVVIGPAERYVVHVRFERPGTVALVNRVRGLDHLFGRFFQETDTLGVVTVSPQRVPNDLGKALAALRRPPPPFAALEPYRRFIDRVPDKTLVLTLATHALPYVTERLMQLDSIYFAPVEWGGTMPMMNWASTGRQVRWVLKDPESGRQNMDIDWSFRRGEPVKLRLVNERRAFHGMQHPIHLHGQRFLVLAVNGVPNTDLAWKDTVLVPAGSVVDILLDLGRDDDALHRELARSLHVRAHTPARSDRAASRLVHGAGPRVHHRGYVAARADARVARGWNRRRAQGEPDHRAARRPDRVGGAVVGGARSRRREDAGLERLDGDSGARRDARPSVLHGGGRARGADVVHRAEAVSGLGRDHDSHHGQPRAVRRDQSQGHHRSRVRPGTADPPHRALYHRRAGRRRDGDPEFPGSGAPLRGVLGGRGRDVDQGVHGHSSRRARRRDSGSTQARRQSHGTPVLGEFPGSGRAGDR